ncbi:Methyltransferase domain-containing protein [Syntrophus gentianae]|uniref:Methyltransferase domain-containing protein n=1 Tax=Syntrophus gentianae TaxID=43775 RepID=A0A1H7VK10_9BACT|nr:methyltransferase domain-containing protein [Syntrophus gentianae]SEM09563.1 Methyltransferase domain-containing protein [Syntrophus gentianae]
MSDGHDRRINPIKRLHFEKLSPLCPVCRTAGRESPLKIGAVLKEGKDTITEGVLVCSNSSCLSEYPVLDGIPILVANLRTYIAQNFLPILCRDDLSETMESLLGDCFGPGSAFDSQRQYLSTYAFDHYGDLDPEEPAPSSAPPGSVLNLLREGLQVAGHAQRGPVIDIGCAVGRTSFELGKALDEIVLGIDLNFGMLKTAAAILEKGCLSYPRRRGGIAFERRRFPVSFDKAEKVDFWVCDATALPFAEGTFSAGVSLNVLDCVWSPYDYLREISRILMPGGNAVLSTPYDWTANATPVEAWLGGHSQRSEHKGSSPDVLRSLLSGGLHPHAVEALELISEKDVPWTLRLHDRSIMEYLVHLMVIRKKHGE